MSVWMFSSIVGQSLPSAAVEFAFGSWPSEGIVKPRRPQGIHLPETQDEPFRLTECHSGLAYSAEVLDPGDHGKRRAFRVGWDGDPICHTSGPSAGGPLGRSPSIGLGRGFVPWWGNPLLRPASVRGGRVPA